MKFKDKLFITGKTIFEKLFKIKIPEPEITRCPYCNWSLSKVHQCHYIELNRPEFFRMKEFEKWLEENSEEPLKMPMKEKS